MLATLQKSWEKKLLYIANLLGKLEEVVNAPAAVAQDDEDTCKTRQFNLRAQDRVYDEAKQVFVRWKITFQRSKELFKDLLAAFKTKDKEKPETKGPRTRGHSPDKNKNVSTTDAKALRPEMLDTSIHSMQMNDW